MNEGHHQTLYETAEFYWGKEPNDFARRTLAFIPQKPLRAIDIGAGEGRDAVFFAEGGFDVLAVDTATNGLKKAIRLAREHGVEIEVREGDVNSLELEGSFDLVYSAGTIQYLIRNPGEEFRFSGGGRRSASFGANRGKAANRATGSRERCFFDSRGTTPRFAPPDVCGSDHPDSV